MYTVNAFDKGEASHNCILIQNRLCKYNGLRFHKMD